jgi:hypothetical protein
MLVEELELGTLWDEYGLVGDLVVCIVLSFFIHYLFVLPFLGQFHVPTFQDFSVWWHTYFCQDLCTLDVVSFDTIDTSRP